MKSVILSLGRCAKGIGVFLLVLTIHLSIMVLGMVAIYSLIQFLVRSPAGQWLVVSVTGNDPEFAMIFLPCVLSYAACTTVAERLRSNGALLALGIFILVGHVSGVIMDIANGSPIFASVIQIIYGLILVHAWKKQKEYCASKSQRGKEHESAALASEPEQEQPVTNEPPAPAPREYVYDVAANGLTVRIPLDKYASWKEAQDKIRAGMSEQNTQAVEQLGSIMRKRDYIYDKEEQKGYVCDKWSNRLEVRIPSSIHKSWSEAQDRMKSGSQKKEL